LRTCYANRHGRAPVNGGRSALQNSLFFAPPRISPVLRTWENAPRNFRTACAVRIIPPPPGAVRLRRPLAFLRPDRPPGPERACAGPAWGPVPAAAEPGWGRVSAAAPLNAPPPLRLTPERAPQRGRWTRPQSPLAPLFLRQTTALLATPSSAEPSAASVGASQFFLVCYASSLTQVFTGSRH
jgi:hypothetical protein